MMLKTAILIVAVLAVTANAVPSRFRRSYGVPLAHPVPATVPVPALAAVPGIAAVPGVAAVPTLTAVHSQRLIPQAPAVHTVAHPTTVLQTVQTGNAIVGHQKVADQIVGKTADVNGYAFSSEVRHDAPIHVAAPAVVAAPVLAPAPILSAPVLAHAPLPVPVAAPLPVLAAPAPIVAGPLPLALPAYKKA